jgi:hypothetical protein
MSESLLLPVLASAVLLALLVAFRASEATRLAAEHRTFRLSFGRDLSADAVVRFCTALSGLVTPRRYELVGMEAVVFETAAEGDRITHRLTVPARIAETVTAQLGAALPGVRYAPEDDYRLPRLRLAREVRLPVTGVPLRTDQPEASAVALLAALQPLQPGEAAVMQWIVRPAASRRALPDHQRQSLVSLLTDADQGATAEARRNERRKLAEPLFLAVGRVGVTASPGRARQVLRRLVAALHVLNVPGAGLRVRLLPTGIATRRLEQRRVPLLGWPCLLNAAELASLLAYPAGAPLLLGLRLGGARHLPPVSELPTEGTVLGHATFPGAERPIAIGARERLQHLYCLAPTGAGKSTLLANIAAQDMQGDGALVVFDTKADLLEAVLARVPEHRRQDVIVLDPTDTERPVGFNLIGGPASDRELLVENVVSIFRNLYDGGAGGTLGPRSEDVLRAVLLTLTLHPGTTLTEAPRLISDERFRSWFLARLDEPVALGRFWQWAEGTSKAEWAAATAPLGNKLRAFLGRERIRLILGQADGRLDFDKVLSEGRILLVSLAKGTLGESAANLLGALVLAKLWQAVLRRSVLAPEHRRPVSIVLDEFSDYVGLATPLPDLLAQGRGLGASVVLAHQAVHQVPSDIRHAALANCRSKVVWQLSADDARVLAREFHPYLTADDLQGLGPYEIAALIATGGSVAPPVTGATLPLSPPLTDAARLRTLSRQQWGRPRTEVEAAIRKRQGDNPKPAPVGRTRRAS